MHKNDQELPATPALSQYLQIKKQQQNTLLFYRLGDFYEMFFEDAKKASVILGIALTKRGQFQGQDVPMCGVPAHAADSYIAKLIQHGERVAICEQVENAEQAKKRGSKNIIERRIVRIITPGTITEDSLLDNKRNNYLAALIDNNDLLAIAWIDLSTADFSTIIIGKNDLVSWLERINPKELLIPDGRDTILPSQMPENWQKNLVYRPQDRFEQRSARGRLLKAYNTQALDGFGAFTDLEICAAGALIEYIDLTQQGQFPVLKPLKKVLDHQVMAIDAFTWRSLEIDKTQSNRFEGSLLHVIDRNCTAAGARCLATWLTYPLTNVDQINQRQLIVEFFVAHEQIRDHVRRILSKMADLQRALSRLMVGRGTPRDLGAIQASLQHVMVIRQILNAISLPQSLQQLVGSIKDHQGLIQILSKALSAVLPIDIKEGGFIASGYHPELDEWRKLRDGAKQQIVGLENRYRDLSGVNSLKIKHNNILGYYIETTALQAQKLFEDSAKTFIHRQTMAGSVRFITSELNDLQQKIFQSADKVIALEIELFQELVQQIKNQADSIQITADIIAQLDVLISLASLAVEQAYTRPVVDNSLYFEVTEGRHPVVEFMLLKNNQTFIANDCHVNPGQQLWLITGPNMAGKSTFLRQNALIAILAQIGSFVPAKNARIGIIDKLFSRVGAADDLARGQSTFMVEMIETAAILNQATARSFVIFDEIGRGTSTFDGLSIAWAILEHMHSNVKSRCLFATHYRELANLEQKLASLRCYCFKLKEWRDNIVFLHQLVLGVADRSYGIDVARLAGVPKTVTDRARNILVQLEKNNENPKNAYVLKETLPLFQEKEKTPTVHTQTPQLTIIDALIGMDLNNLSPKQALDKLYELQKKALG